MKNMNNPLNVIGQTVSYWRGGDGGGTAKIISIAKPIEYSSYSKKIHNDCRTDVVFLAKNLDGSYVLIRPRFYWGNKHPTGTGLYINWELNFSCAFPKKDEKDMFPEDKDKLGFRLDFTE